MTPRGPPYVYDFIFRILGGNNEPVFCKQQNLVPEAVAELARGRNGELGHITCKLKMG